MPLIQMKYLLNKDIKQWQINLIQWLLSTDKAPAKLENSDELKG